MIFDQLAWEEKVTLHHRTRCLMETANAVCIRWLIRHWIIIWIRLLSGKNRAENDVRGRQCSHKDDRLISFEKSLTRFISYSNSSVANNVCDKTISGGSCWQQGQRTAAQQAARTLHLSIQVNLLTSNEPQDKLEWREREKDVRMKNKLDQAAQWQMDIMISW
jgi:hypothetical protein